MSVLFRKILDRALGMVGDVPIVLSLAGMQSIEGEGLASRVNDSAARHACADHRSQHGSGAIGKAYGLGIHGIPVIEYIGTGAYLGDAVKAMALECGGCIAAAHHGIRDSSGVEQRIQPVEPLILAR